MRFIEIISEDLEVVYLLKRKIVCMFTYNGDFFAEMIGGREFKVKYREIKETDTMVSIKNNKYGSIHNKCSNKKD